VGVGGRRTCENIPKGVWRVCTTCPTPRHEGQVLAEVPALAPDPLHCEHVSKWLISMRFSAANTDSFRSRLISILPRHHQQLQTWALRGGRGG